MSHLTSPITHNVMTTTPSFPICNENTNDKETVYKRKDKLYCDYHNYKIMSIEN